MFKRHHAQAVFIIMLIDGLALALIFNGPRSCRSRSSSALSNKHGHFYPVADKPNQLITENHQLNDLWHPNDPH